MCVDVVLLSVDSPVLLGIYENKKLIKSFEKEGRVGDILPIMFSDILNQFDLDCIFYANGPGNFSAIKLTHIFLQTLSITKKISLFCADSFCFTTQYYINAYGKIHFYKQNETILSARLEEKIQSKFELPKWINPKIFNTNCLPLYVLEGV